MTSHTDACQLVERAAHLMRLGLAVDMARNKGVVEVLISDLDATAHVLAHPDLAGACDKGGDALDGPVALTDEPSGDAMRWTGEPIEELIEASSFGTPEAKALRASVSDEEAAKIVRGARELEREGQCDG